MEKGGKQDNESVPKGMFEVLEADVALSGLAHAAQKNEMRTAEIRMEDGRKVVVAMDTAEETSSVVKAAIELARKGAQEGPVLLNEEND